MMNVKKIILASLFINTYGFLLNNNFKKYNKNQFSLNKNKDNIKIYYNNVDYSLLCNINTYTMFLNNGNYTNNDYIKSYINYLNITLKK